MSEKDKGYKKRERVQINKIINERENQHQRNIMDKRLL